MGPLVGAFQAAMPDTGYAHMLVGLTLKMVQ